MRHPDLASARAKSDAALSLKIDAAWDADRKLYGAWTIWHVLRRQGEDAAPLSANACLRLSGDGSTVEWLMRRPGIAGVVRGKKVITTNPDRSLPCPDDIGVFSKKRAPLVNRLFMADRPNKLPTGFPGQEVHVVQFLARRFLHEQVQRLRLIEAASRRQKWIDQAQSLNLFKKYMSCNFLPEIGRAHV